MAHNLPSGSKGNCTPEYGQQSLEASEFGVDGQPTVLDTRGKAPKEADLIGGEEEFHFPGGKGYVGPEASAEDALGEFTPSKAGGRYGSAKSSQADIPLSSNGPETRSGM